MKITPLADTHRNGQKIILSECPQYNSGESQQWLHFMSIFIA
jgi:hypothetical protein